MKIDGKVSYFKALILTPERIHELEEVLHTFCERITYEASTFSNSEIAFSDANELLQYDNFQKKRVRELAVLGYIKYDRIFRVVFVFSPSWCRFRGYDETCVCYYTLASIDEENLFTAKIKAFLKKATTHYWAWGKLSLWGLITSCCAIMTIYNFFSGRFNNLSISPTMLCVCTFFGCVIMFLLAAFDRFIIRNVFPPIVYLWGEEIERNKRFEKGRSNFLWGVIVAIIVGLFTTVLAKAFIH